MWVLYTSHFHSVNIIWNIGSISAVLSCSVLGGWPRAHFPEKSGWKSSLSGTGLQIYLFWSGTGLESQGLSGKQKYQTNSTFVKCLHNNDETIWIKISDTIELLPFKVTVYLRGCLSRKKIFAHYLKRNHHKLYISTKLMKCTIR